MHNKNRYSALQTLQKNYLFIYSLFILRYKHISKYLQEVKRKIKLCTIKTVIQRYKPYKKIIYLFIVYLSYDTNIYLNIHEYDSFVTFDVLFVDIGYEISTRTYSR